jgi:hypothetical protein
VRDEYLAFNKRTGRSYLFSISDLTISEEPLDFLKKQTMTGTLETNTTSSKLAWSVMVGMLIVADNRRSRIAGSGFESGYRTIDVVGVGTLGSVRRRMSVTRSYHLSTQ